MADTSTAASNDRSRPLRGGSQPSYLVHDSRWLVTNPQDADGSGRFRVASDNQLWAEVWTGQLEVGVKLTAHAGGMIRFDLGDEPAQKAASATSNAAASTQGSHDVIVLMNAFEYALCLALNEAGGQRHFRNIAITSQHIIWMPIDRGPIAFGSMAKGSLEDARATVENRQKSLGVAQSSRRRPWTKP